MLCVSNFLVTIIIVVHVGFLYLRGKSIKKNFENGIKWKRGFSKSALETCFKFLIDTVNIFHVIVWFFDLAIVR